MCPSIVDFLDPPAIATPLYAQAWLPYVAEATLVQHHEPVLVPGPLQNAGYAEAVTRELRGQNDAFCRQFAEHRRRLRNHLLLTNRATLHCVIGEGALRRLVGDWSVMVDQLSFLLTLPADQVNIQIAPYSIGAYPGAGFSYTVVGDLSYSEDDVSDRIYRGEDAAKHQAMFEAAAARALDSEPSRGLIRIIIEQLRAENA